MSYLFPIYLIFFFFNDTATTEIYTLSLHDALPIYAQAYLSGLLSGMERKSAEGIAYYFDQGRKGLQNFLGISPRSEEHTSELQSRQYLVCRLLLEKKKKTNDITSYSYRTIIKSIT